ncbi:MAG: hypothetical protein K8U03_20165 [Planctomycetia bacterium]|nr:hypothetical protein [Planctomycetia bacterium]
MTARPLPWKRIRLCAKLLAGAAAVGAVSLWLPERPHLYFDLGIAVLLLMGILFAARFSLRQYIERPHAEMISLMHGVAAAGAIYGVLAVAFSGDSVGVEEVLRLTVGFTVAATLGAAWALIAGIVCYWPVYALTRKVLKLSFRHEAAAIGAVAGLLAFTPLLATGEFRWTVVAASTLSALCTHRAAALHQRYTRRKGRA